VAKSALIIGIAGQDGAYLSRLLLEKGYVVHGCVRRNGSVAPWRLKELGIQDDIRVMDFDLLESANSIRVIERSQADEVYNFGALSSVGTSFEQPLLTGDTNALGVTRLLEAIREICPKTRFYQASTCEMFGNAETAPQDERTAFHPRSPYGASKLYGHWTTINYREAYGMFTVSGILFNHESPLRGRQFVTRKITRAIAQIAEGKAEKVMLGNLDASRDWGHAADYVRGIWQMLQAQAPSDYVLATGQTRSIRDFVTAAGKTIGLDIVWQGKGIEEKGIDRNSGRQIVGVDPQFFRPAEIENLVGNPAKAEKELGWRPTYSFENLVAEMVEADLRRVRTDAI
jgi:GDPmannose 4,6-dehydratase